MLKIRLGVHIGDRAYDRRRDRYKLYLETEGAVAILVRCSHKATQVVYTPGGTEKERSLEEEINMSCI